MSAALALLVAAAMAAAGPDAAAPAHAPVEAAESSYTYTVGAFHPEYEPPAPGTYTLPVIDRIEAHRLRDSEAAAVELTALKRDRLAVIAFIYTSCPEVTGCPLADAILQRVDRQLAGDPALAARVRLVTISFDPERDTPARLAATRRALAPHTDWVFLTTDGAAQLTPILDDFGQRVAKLYYADGTWTGLYRHVLKIFLLDEQNRVRNIYSSGLVGPDLVMNDLRTLAGEAKD